MRRYDFPKWRATKKAMQEEEAQNNEIVGKPSTERFNVVVKFEQCLLAISKTFTKQMFSNMTSYVTPICLERILPELTRI